MILKEKRSEGISAAEAPVQATERRNRVNPLLSAVISCLCGAAFCGAFSGGTAVPVCPSLTAILQPVYGLCVFVGAAASYIAAGTAGGFVTEIIAMPLILCIRLAARLFFGEVRPSPKNAAFTAGLVYFISGIAAALAMKITFVLVAAIFFRGIICGTVAYFAALCFGELSDNGKISVTGEKGVAAAVLYVLTISALSGARLGSLCVGRAVGIFIILAAGGRFGGTGSAAVGALTALGIILAESAGTELPDMVRSTALINCSGLISGCVSGKGRTASSVFFSVSMMVLILFMGKIQWAAELMTDTIASAALYCLVPDRFYMRTVNGTLKRGSAVIDHFGGVMDFAARAIGGIRKSVMKASALLSEINGEDNEIDIAEKACREICSECRNNEFCCKGNSRRAKYILPEAVHLLEIKGYITEKELPKVLEGCTKKTEITELLNDMHYMNKMAQGGRRTSERLMECLDEQLSSAEDMLGGMGSSLTDGRIYDEGLSERVKIAAERFGAKNASAAVYFDAAGHIFISCFTEERLESPIEELTQKLSSMTDRELEKPIIFNEEGFIRICWHEFPCFKTETGKSVLNGREETSGDCSAEFYDGEGNAYFLISDGMGSGNRAALESNMTAAILARLIRSGTGAEAALKIVNTILISKSEDEIFATADLLKINLFSGRIDIFKAGAAPSFIKTGGTVKTVESRTFPLGIMPHIQTERRTLRLSDGECAVILSDGISEESYPKLRELMLSDGYSPQRCADAIIENDKCCKKMSSDDRTVLVVKLHKF